MEKKGEDTIINRNSGLQDLRIKSGDTGTPCSLCQQNIALPKPAS